jgi:glycosyltransferase involved in cell wall biosynthesis
VAKVAFWQLLVSPHTAGLARSLAMAGDEVTFIAPELMSGDRANQGWSAPEIPGAQLRILGSSREVSSLIQQLKGETVHVAQGLRRNGYVGEVIERLRAHGARWGVMMETVDDRGLLGMLKRANYRWALRRSKPDFILAIGSRNPGWISARGYPQAGIFPFAYFLEPLTRFELGRNAGNVLKVGFVGSLVPWKRLDLLIEALGSLCNPAVELIVVGDGPLAARLKRLAATVLKPHQVRWLGRLPMDRARAEIAGLDCLVLPSDHDGWGAVVSEALMAGVPAVCSDACGSAVAVHASGVGGVFPAGDAAKLRDILTNVTSAGRLEMKEREELVDWARSLSADAGAEYLKAIIACVYEDAPRPREPWAVGRKGLVNIESRLSG